VKENNLDGKGDGVSEGKLGGQVLARADGIGGRVQEPSFHPKGDAWNHLDLEAQAKSKPPGFPAWRRSSNYNFLRLTFRAEKLTTVPRSSQVEIARAKWLRLNPLNQALD
jgi:hypothetical protein